MQSEDNQGIVPLLQIEGISKTYGDNKVLDNCTFDIQAGEIHALLGGNGAGKSTLVRIISGLIQPSSGTMKYCGKEYSPRSKSEAERTGVEIVQQEFNLIPTLSVAENLYLTRLPQVCGVVRRNVLFDKAQNALSRVGLQSVSPKVMVSSLGVGQQQLVEIASALDRDCKLLILDEPTAALSSGESEVLFQWLLKLKNQGTSIIYISHRLDEVKRIADRVSFLRDGKYVSTSLISDIDVDGMLREMSGESRISAGLSKDISKKNDDVKLPNNHTDNVVLKVKNLSGGMVKPASFQVHSGERLGITGLVGSGRTELLRLLFGADRASLGEVEINDGTNWNRYSAFRSPSHAVSAGLAMITEDRKSNGVLLEQSVRANSSLTALANRFSSLGIIRRKTESEFAEQMRQNLSIRSTSIEQLVRALSGGNQQKVALAKWLASDAKVFLLDEPTRGIDIPARQKIYDLMNELAANGRALIIVSSDLEELFQNCDRILVMTNGAIMDEINKDNFDRDRIMRSSFEGYRDGSTVV